MTAVAGLAGSAASLDVALDAGTPALFGQGGGLPYAHALLRAGGTLHLADEGSFGDELAFGPGAPERFDVGAWFHATAGERSLLAELAELAGPVLDVGCGPGRLVAAARELGLDAVGIDVDPEAVRLVRRAGCEAILGSVFDDSAVLPATGRYGTGWGSALLLDGNIGIGGHPRMLLARLRQITRPGALAWVETAVAPWAYRRFTARLRDGLGRESSPFPWARVGWKALGSVADAAGWDPAATRDVEGRKFSLLRRR